MSLSLLLVAGFAGSLAVPLLHRASSRFATLLAIGVPTLLCGWLATNVAPVSRGVFLQSVHTWVPSLGIGFSLRLDGLSLLFALLITGIGAAVAIYASGYLPDNARRARFYAYLLAFMSSMLGVVLSSDVFLIFVFWELTSITSFLLIGFDHEQEGSRKAAVQALLTTGMGGLAMLVGLVVLQNAAGSSEIGDWVALGPALRAHPAYAPALVLLLLGAYTKSAQFPFHFWLPSAMAAPTPVSAYLHSATMVKAGVYLLARLLPALGGTTLWYVLVGGAGAVTMVAGAVLSLRQRDLKAVLAYATVSALGVMVMLVGIGTQTAMLALVVYLTAHAAYKSSLFLVAGAIDHETGTRDLAQLGGLGRTLPLIAAAGALAALSMAGLPPFLGFVGKEALYEAVLHAPRWAVAATVLAVLSHVLLFTVACRTGVSPFVGAPKRTPREPHGAPATLWLPPLALASVGLVAAFFLAAFDRVFVSPAVSATSDPLVVAHLSLWHGITPMLLLSLVTVGAGILAMIFWPRVWSWSAGLDRLNRYGPAQWYEWALVGLNRVGKAQTDALQNGVLHHYTSIVLVTATLAIGLTMLTRGWHLGPITLGDARFYEVIVVAIILAAALATVLARSHLAAVAFMGLVGYGVSLIYVWYGAPDLAMTQFMIETLVVILFVSFLYKLPPHPILSSRGTRLRDGALSLAAGGTMGALALIASDVALPSRISDFHLRNSYLLAHGRNVVNVILVDFRALDTLGEITVLTVAAVGVFALLRFSVRRERR